MSRTTTGHEKLTHAEWVAEGNALFGADSKMRDWRFVCPQCATVTSGQDFMDLFRSQGLTEDEANVKGAQMAGRACIGRHTSDAGCDWCAWGLFRGPREVVLPRSDPAVDGSFPDETLAEQQDRSIWCFRFAE